jgi:Na+-driven multidrug efflux pump
MEKLKNSIFLFNALVLLAFVSLAVMANHYPEGARVFPNFILAIGIGVITLWMLFYFFLPSFMRFIEVQEEKEENPSGSSLRFYQALLCIGFPILVGYLCGFIFLVPLAFLSYGLSLGDKKKLLSLVIVMAVTTILLFIGFDYILHIPLRKGILLDLG